MYYHDTEFHFHFIICAQARSKKVKCQMTKADKVVASEVDILQWYYNLKEQTKKKADKDADLQRCRVVNRCPA
jgi:vancomycin resistance protein YoaR